MRRAKFQRREVYGALYHALTGRVVAEGAELITHGMSFVRSHVAELLQAFSPPGAPWRSEAWVLHALRALCPAAAFGFSEYWYDASHSHSEGARSTAHRTHLSHSPPGRRYYASHVLERHKGSTMLRVSEDIRSALYARANRSVCAGDGGVCTAGCAARMARFAFIVAESNKGRKTSLKNASEAPRAAVCAEQRAGRRKSNRL